jgi:ribonuclease VapC
VILDSSAIVAIFLKEPGYQRLLSALDGDDLVGIGAPTLVEAAIVLSARLKTNMRQLVEDFLSELNIQIVPFTSEHWRAALDAFVRFGKGRHPAGLNFGDCLSYAVAFVAGRPLLAKGDDFRKTDLQVVD